MLISEAMTVFWQSLKDTWEELLPLSIVNLVWLFSWALPLAAIVSVSAPALIIALLLLGVLLFPVTTAGIYYVTNRVAHAKTFHFYDFVEGIKIYWWRAIVWLLVNVLVVFLVWTNLAFYPRAFEGGWVVFVQGLWLAVLAFWLVMQLYFWPMLIQLEEPRMLLAWRNSALLILVNPFYAFFVVSFTLVLTIISVVLSVVFMFAGMTIIALIGNNALLILLHRLGKIEDPRPKPPGRG